LSWLRPRNRRTYFSGHFSIARYRWYRSPELNPRNSRSKRDRRQSQLSVVSLPRNQPHPGSSVSATIRRFNAAGHCRRRPTAAACLVSAKTFVDTSFPSSAMPDHRKYKQQTAGDLRRTLTPQLAVDGHQPDRLNIIIFTQYSLCGAGAAGRAARFHSTGIGNARQPTTDLWLHEIKFDGCRAAARLCGGRTSVSRGRVA